MPPPPIPVRVSRKGLTSVFPYAGVRVCANQCSRSRVCGCVLRQCPRSRVRVCAPSVVPLCGCTGAILWKKKAPLRDPVNK